MNINYLSTDYRILRFFVGEDFMNLAFVHLTQEHCLLWLSIVVSVLNVRGYMCCESGELYTSDVDGSDECGDGTEQKPFKTILQVSLFIMPTLVFLQIALFVSK